MRIATARVLDWPPVNLLVLGNSDYDGSLLADPLESWPHLVGRRLGDQLGTPVTVVNRNLVPSRRSVLNEVETLIGEYRPDLVIVGLNPYSFAVTTVAARVRERFGHSAARAYTRLERSFDARTRRGRVRTRANRVMRQFARTTLGAAPLAPVEQVIDTYRSVFARLAQEEETQAIVMGGSRLSLNPHLVDGRLLGAVDRFRDEMRAAAEGHRFPFFDTEPTVAGSERESYFMPDGVHRNERGHARLAEMVYPVILAEAERLGFLAPAGG